MERLACAMSVCLLLAVSAACNRTQSAQSQPSDASNPSAAVTPSASKETTASSRTSVPQQTAEATTDKSAEASSTCPPGSIKLRDSEPPIQVQIKLRGTPDGDTVDELVLFRAQPPLQQTLTVGEMDALSVLDKCSVGTQDIDFDGYNDLLVDVRAGVANTYAQYWRYDPDARSFVSLGEYPEFKLDRARKRLKTYERNGSAGLEYESREYAVQNGSLVLMKQETQTAVPDSAGFERTVAVRSGAEMKIVQRRVIHPKQSANEAH